MSAADRSIRYRQLRAPRESGTALVDPPITEAAGLIAANRALAGQWDSASGLPFGRWRSEARSSLLFRAARQGSTVNRAEVDALEQRPLVLTGHQPELFHPGVWFKNLLASRIAGLVEGTAVNLVIDNDTIRHSGIRVPTGSLASPRLVEVPLDAPANEMPLEERRIGDVAFFRSFAGRVHRAVDPILANGGQGGPIVVDRLWEHVRQIVRTEMEGPPAGIPDDRPQADMRLLLGDCLAKARARYERDLGLATGDVWLRTICAGWPYRYFFAHLISNWHRWHQVYNAALAEFRTVNHIRSRRQPAPDLAVDGPWLEAPFWIWTADQPQRRRAFVRHRGEGWELTDRQGLILRSNGREDGDDGIIPWDTAEFRHDVKIRPRAFITTMYARLVLSDLFIHGIGGAKYDELTDALIRRFFGIEPPAYVTATATFRLPIDRPNVTEDDVRGIERRIRDTVHHPESFVEDAFGSARRELAQLAEDKRELIAARWQDKQKKAWHDRVTHCNERMTALLSDVRERLIAQRQYLLSQLHASQLLASREFSFVLFPEETLPRALLDLCGGNA